MKSLLREPLVHFLLIGAALFIMFEIFDDPVGPDTSHIVISAGQIEFLSANFSRTWKRPPNENELQNLVDYHVREEILYREALALGLDKNDQVVRQRLKQKMELMASDLIQALTPSDEELTRYLTDHPDKFRIAPRLSFSHIFLDPQKRGRALEDDAALILQQLTTSDIMSDPSSFGDSLLIPRVINFGTTSEIRRSFGEVFSKAILEIPPGSWTGPVRSGYGYHLVLVTEKIDSRIPELSEIREQVEREWMAAGKKKLNEDLMAKLRENYTVEIKWPSADEPGTPAETTEQGNS